MRTLNQCFNRPQTLAYVGFQEEGRGLGFSIGGWHPFRANTYLPTLKKLDPLSGTSIGKQIWKPIEKAEKSVNKDFQKVKKWSQDHRKQLQIAAALAAMAVGGMYALGYLGSGAASAGAAGTAAAEAASAEALGAAAATGASEAAIGTAAAAEGVGAATAAGAAAESTIATTALATETLAPIATGSATASGLSLVPATVPTAAAVSTSAFTPLVATEAATAGSGAGIFGTLGSAAKSIAPLMALSKLVGVTPQQPQQETGGYGGFIPMNFGSSGGGGAMLGPALPMGPEQPATASAPAQAIPAWVLPAAAVGLLVFLIKE